MSYGVNIKELLVPLGVYDLEQGIGLGEIESYGSGLDKLSSEVALVEREMLLSTACGDGLDNIESLLSSRPVTVDTARRREALAALLRIGGDSFTLSAINDNLTGCGLNVLAEEGEEVATVQISFPEVVGVPDGIDEMKVIIENILPAHLGIEYIYWYITWGMLADKVGTWGFMEDEQWTWKTVEEMEE